MKRFRQSLSIVIPAYNEKDNIKQAILDVVAKYPGVEIIVVNDASTDGTFHILLDLYREIEGLKILSNYPNRGHGYSVVKGLKKATGDYILYVDADRQIELGEILLGCDIVSGYRANRHDKLFRKTTSFLLKMTNLLFHGYYIKDANCPYKIYRRSTIKPLLDLLPQDYIIPIACLEVLARQHGLRTATIKTPHLPYQGVRQGFLQIPNKKFFLFAWRAFKEITSL